MRLVLIAASLLLAAFGTARADTRSGALPAPTADTASPGLLCRAAITAAEKAAAIPEHLLAAIGRVESGRRDPASGAWHPWPWTINAEGQGFFYETKQAAIEAVRALQARGVRSIDIGCMQVNLMHHPNAFASLEDGFEPRINAAYAARFLTSLFRQTDSWPKSAAMYHSATPELGDAYQSKVLALWPGESLRQKDAAVPPPPKPDPMQEWASRLPAAPSNRVAVVLPPNPSDQIHVMPINTQGASPGGIVQAQGRGLDAYRAAPIAMIARPPRPGT